MLVCCGGLAVGSNQLTPSAPNEATCEAHPQVLIEGVHKGRKATKGEEQEQGQEKQEEQEEEEEKKKNKLQTKE